MTEHIANEGSRSLYPKIEASFLNLSHPDQERIAELSTAVVETGIGGIMLHHLLDEAYGDPANTQWALEGGALKTTVKTLETDTWDYEVHKWVTAPAVTYRKDRALTEGQTHVLQIAQNLAATSLTARISMNDRLGPHVASPTGELRRLLLADPVMQERVRAANYDPHDRRKTRYANCRLIGFAALYAAGRFPVQ